MNEIRSIDTEYKGYLFRSRLEARWAVFFDACGVDWEYEPEGFDLGNGVCYLPDFLLHDVRGRVNGDLYVEVKGQMSEGDAVKIKKFVEASVYKDEAGRKHIGKPLLVVGRIPPEDNIRDIDSYIEDCAYPYKEPVGGIYCFNFETIDFDYFAAHPGISKEGHFELFGDDGSYLALRDDARTLRAYRKAKQARFEHGQTPVHRRGIK